MLLEKEKIFYLHIPKTGGTAVDKFLGSKYGYEPHNFATMHWGFTQVLMPHSSHAWTIQSIVHLKYSEQLKIATNGKINVDNSWNIFTIVRNPYTRMISEFAWQTYFPVKSNLYTLRTLKEKQYLINECQKKFFNEDPQQNNWFNHRVPQHILCDFTSELPDCKVFKYEEGLENILKKVLPNVDIKLNRTNDPAKELKVKKIDYTSLYTKNFIENCNDWYKKDFERFDYEMLNPNDYPDF